MNLNRMLNKKLQSEIHLVTNWVDNKSSVDLHFGWNGGRDCERVRNILERSNLFIVEQVHGWRLNWLVVRRGK